MSRFVYLDQAPVAVEYSHRSPFWCEAVTNKGERCKNRARYSERPHHHTGAIVVLCTRHHDIFHRQRSIEVATS